MALKKKEVLRVVDIIDDKHKLTPLSRELLISILRVLAFEIDAQGLLSERDLTRVLSDPELEKLIQMEINRSSEIQNEGKALHTSPHLTGVAILHLVSSRTFMRYFIERTRSQVEDRNFMGWVTFDKE